MSHRWGRRTRAAITVPEPLRTVLGKITPSLGKGSTLTMLLRKDFKVTKMGAHKAKRKHGTVALGPTSVTVGTYRRVRAAAAKLNMPMADVWRVIVHTTLPHIEEAAAAAEASRPQPLVEVGCPHCGK